MEGTAFIMSSTCLHSTKWNVNCSDVGETLGVKMLLLKSKLSSSAKDSIFELVDFPTDAKKLLKVPATILSSLL